jgi:FAD/FMN-containing dehydrogenase/Fe-S oxidoreductase
LLPRFFYLEQVTSPYAQLASQLAGDLLYGKLVRHIYATDASMYRELPSAVAFPRDTADIRALILFATHHRLSLIPRGAGTSLAGQCVGAGIVVDCSRYMDQVLEFNPREKWVKVQPGIVRDHLNAYLRPYGLHFGVNTSTSNRATIGGMVGNNSCGSTSIVYGTTRDHLLEMEVLLHDGSSQVFAKEDPLTFEAHCSTSDTAGVLYRMLREALANEETRAAILGEYAHPDIHRRNTGYALDALIRSSVFSPSSDQPFSFCDLLAGSEGTLAFTTSVKLALQPLPPPVGALVCAHFSSLRESLESVVLAMQHDLYACELMDKKILDCTAENRAQRENRFFLRGDPEAVLILEVRAHEQQDLQRQVDALIVALQQAGKGYAYPIVEANNMERVWSLRKAGLGVLANLPGAARAVACVEDTAVRIEDLPDYIDAFSAIMAANGQEAIYYAHAGAGELHLRPILDLRQKKHLKQLEIITRATARLVKQYQGAWSGEHGDGRVRAPFLPELYSEQLIALFEALKSTWDPASIFNPGKIVDPKPPTEDLRVVPGEKPPQLESVYDFPGGVFHTAERCNGSGDCRKMDGVMCPSYQVSGREEDTTRARANALREFLQMPSPQPFDHPELKEVLDLCISCKGCTRECPSNVNMTLLKSEFQYQYYQSHRRPIRDGLFARYDRLMKVASRWPRLSNIFLGSSLPTALPQRILGIAPQRSLPKVARVPLDKWFHRRKLTPTAQRTKARKVFLLADEFLNYSEVEIGQAAVFLLEGLGYVVELLPCLPSGRTYLSKGYLEEARELAQQQVERYYGRISPESPLIGLEPSALLSFREEYPLLLRGELQDQAKQLVPSCLLLEEFLVQEAAAGRIDSTLFQDVSLSIKVHLHCHQKALAGTAATLFALNLPTGFRVELLQNSCCGMAGSFGFEAEHYAFSRSIGERSLQELIHHTPTEVQVVASGVSCRQQIKDLSGRDALHPAQLLWQVLKK